MPSRRASIALSTSLLGLGILACNDKNPNDPLGLMEAGDEDPTGSDMDAGDDDDDDDDDDADGGTAGCGPDPECTTDAPCGNDEVCSQCVCVHKCSGVGDCFDDDDCGPNERCESCMCAHPCADSLEGCTNDDDCESGSCNPMGCMCETLPEACGPSNECDADEDCGTNEVCNIGSCMCEPGECECQYGGPLCGDGEYCDGCNCQDAPGLEDPADDCEADGTPVECADGIDLVSTEVSCGAGAISVTAYFEQPVAPTPSTSQRRIVEFLDPLGYLTLRMYAVAPGDGVGTYDCSVITPGVMMNELGPDDVCEINEDGSFQFVLSPESAMLATGTISELFARSESSGPLHYDDGDPIPNPCM